MVDAEENVVFVVDASGSMQAENSAALQTSAMF